MDFIMFVIQLGVLALIGGVVFLFVTYNRMQRLAQEIRESSSNVQIAISRKLSLVNQLIDIVKNFQEAEQFTHLKISQDNSAVAMATAYQQSGTIMSSIMAVADRFPDLKANEQYHRLIDSVQQCETDIQTKRQTYNWHVKMYNTQVLSAPTVFVASPLGFSVASYLEFDISGTTEVKPLKEFATDDGARLRELLSKGGEQFGRMGREVMQQASTAGRAMSGRPTNGDHPVNDPIQKITPEYFYLDASGVPSGPVESTAIIAMLAGNRISLDTLIIATGEQEWRPARSILPS